MGISDHQLAFLRWKKGKMWHFSKQSRICKIGKTYIYICFKTNVGKHMICSGKNVRNIFRELLCKSTFHRNPWLFESKMGRLSIKCPCKQIQEDHSAENDGRIYGIIFGLYSEFKHSMGWFPGSSMGNHWCFPVEMSRMNLQVLHHTPCPN